MREGWDIKTLGEIGKVSMCKRILKKQTSPIGDIPFYKIGTFGKIPNAFISKEVYKEYLSKYSFPKKGDILLSASGTIGRRVIYDGKPAYFQDSNIVWIANNEEKVLNEYPFCNRAAFNCWLLIGVFSRQSRIAKNYRVHCHRNSFQPTHFQLSSG